jgi:tRNA-modifying protein YgfZ
MTPLAAQSTDWEAITRACGLVDRSEAGKLALTGPQAAAFLGGQVTNDVEALEPGSGCYAALLTNKGKMLADLRVLAISEPGPELLLLTERAALQALFDVLRRAVIGWDAELHKRTLQQGLLSLVGPQARAVAGAGDLPADEHANRRGELAGRPVVLIATDAGVDVACAAEDVDAVRDALVAAGAAPVAEAAAEALRVATGRPRYGVDLDDTVIPQEAGLNARAVSFSKGCYVGQETVARLHYKGKPNRHLRGLELSAEARRGDVLRKGDREVGRLGSVAVVPGRGPLALALVRREAEVGDVLAVVGGDGDGDGGGGGEGITARVVELPFGGI